MAEKMSNDVRKRLKRQAKKMGVDWDSSKVEFDADGRYQYKGWSEFQKKGALQAMNKGVKEGSLGDRAAARRKKLDDDSGF